MSFTGIPSSSQSEFSSYNELSLVSVTTTTQVTDSFACLSIENSFECASYNNEIKDNYENLNDILLDQEKTIENFKLAYELSFDKKLVPISFDELKEYLTKSTQETKGIDLMYSINEHAMKLIHQSQCERDGITKSQESLKLCLQYLVHIEEPSEQQLWRDLLNSSARLPILNQNMNYIDLKTELETISRQRKEYVSANPSTSFVGGNQVNSLLDSAQIETETFVAISALRDQGQLLSSLRSERYSRVLTVLTPYEKPEIQSPVKDYIEKELIHTCYKFDPTKKNSRDFKLFTLEFHELGTFNDQVDSLFSADCATPEQQIQLFSLHFACKVLIRELPQKQDDKDSSWCTQQVASEHGMDANCKKAKLLTDTINYLTKLQEALEGKASELRIALYHESLIPYFAQEDALFSHST